MKPLSKEIVVTIEQKFRQGLPSRKVATDLGIGCATVNRYMKVLCPDTKKQPSERPLILSPRDCRAITRTITSGEEDTAAGAAPKFSGLTGKTVSVETVQRALKREEMKAALKQKKPFLTPRHRRARMDFARKYKHWTEAD